jgi:hypothetical protein
MKQNLQRKITRYHIARLIGFEWKEAASVGIDVSVFQSMGIYPLNRNIVSEYFFSTSDTSETVSFMETPLPDMAPICAPSTSGTNPQNLSPISAGSSLITLNITLLSDSSPEEVTPARLLKISPVSKIPRKYSISEKQIFFPH